MQNLLFFFFCSSIPLKEWGQGFCPSPCDCRSISFLCGSLTFWAVCVSFAARRISTASLTWSSTQLGPKSFMPFLTSGKNIHGAAGRVGGDRFILRKQEGKDLLLEGWEGARVKIKDIKAKS